VNLFKPVGPRIETFLFILRTTKNWPKVLMARFFSLPCDRVIFRNGYVIDFVWTDFIMHAHLFARVPSAVLSGTFIEFEYLGLKLKFDFGKYGFSTIYEIFGYDPYREFLRTMDIAGREVVDIGASFGDTAIYFVANGASRVFGYEAFPGYQELGKANIDKNGYSDRCSIALCAVGGELGEISVDCGATEMFGTNVPAGGDIRNVAVTTLSSIVTEHSILDGLLKVDTEGFEYEILESVMPETLRCFKYLLIEYHYGYERIEQILDNAGFKFFHTGPTDVFVPHLADEAARNMRTGHVVAVRLD
jgi:FkbM family methyltransferase